jgi:FkbM family methyltransferase
MRPWEAFYLLGFRPRPRTYGHEVQVIELPADGAISYARWLHPGETRKTIRQEEIDELRTFLRPGDVALDIGAHTGDSTLPMALAVGPTGCVLAVEPNPYVFPVLRRNAELNPGKTRILPLPYAATPEDRDYEFEYSDPGFGNGGRHERISRWRHGHAFRLRVAGRNLTRLLRSEHADLLPRLRYVKVDAEGYDHTVLQSLAPILVERRPYLMVEVFKHTRRAQREELLASLTGWGYGVFRREVDAGYRGPRLTASNLMRWRHFDVFCEPEGPG